MTTSKARSLRAVLAAFLIALGAPGAEAGGPRAPEPGKGTKNGGRSEPGKSVPGGRPRDGSGALPGQPGGARAGGRTEDLSRAPRTEPAARGGEAHAPERPLREDPSFARLIEHVPSLQKIVDKNAEKLSKGLTEGNREILDTAARMMSERGKTQETSDAPRIEPPESLRQSVAKADDAIPKSERGVELEQRNGRGQRDFKIEDARRSPVVYIRAYIRGLQAKSEVAQTKLDRMGTQLAERSGGARYEKRSSEKDFTRIMQKVREKDGYASKVYDLAAGRVVYPTMEKLAAGVQGADRVLREHGATIVRVKDRFSEPMSSGYRDVLMNIRTSEGTVAELRFELEPLLAISNEEHVPYELKRGLDDLAARERRPLTSDEKRLQTTLDKITKPTYDQAFDRAVHPPAAGHASQPRRPTRRRPVLRSRRELSLRSTEQGSLETRAMGRPRDGRRRHRRLLRLEGP